MIILKYVLDVIMVKPHHYFAYKQSQEFVKVLCSQLVQKQLRTHCKISQKQITLYLGLSKSHC